MAQGEVGAAVLAAAVGSRTKEPPKPNYPLFGSVGNCMKLFENLEDYNLVNMGDDGVSPSRFQREDSYITYGGGGVNISVGGDNCIEMVGRRGDGNDNNYRSEGGRGGKKYEVIIVKEDGMGVGVILPSCRILLMYYCITWIKYCVVQLILYIYIVIQVFCCVKICIKKISKFYQWV